MESLLIPLIALTAFFLKGVTGTGTTTVIVALGALFLDPKLTIVLASFINIFGGLAMVKIDPLPLSHRYWMPVSLSMVAGSVAGAMALKQMPSQWFQLVLGGAFLITALWFLFRAPARRNLSAPPEKVSVSALSVGGFAGFCGGFIGINAPPLVLYFSRFLDKRHLRRLLVLIFIPAAMAQTATFAVNGMLDRQIMVWGLMVLPAMAAGIWLGNRTFHRISEKRFRQILGAFLVFVSLRLILRSLLYPW